MKVLGSILIAAFCFVGYVYFVYLIFAVIIPAILVS